MFDILQSVTLLSKGCPSTRRSSTSRRRRNCSARWARLPKAAPAGLSTKACLALLRWHRRLKFVAKIASDIAKPNGQRRKIAPVTERRLPRAAADSAAVGRRPQDRGASEAARLSHDWRHRRAASPRRSSASSAPRPRCTSRQARSRDSIRAPSCPTATPRASAPRKPSTRIRLAGGLRRCALTCTRRRCAWRAGCAARASAHAAHAAQAQARRLQARDAPVDLRRPHGRRPGPLPRRLRAPRGQRAPRRPCPASRASPRTALPQPAVAAADVPARAAAEARATC